MNVRTQREFHHRKTLRDAGWDVPQRDSVAFNGGSETPEHFFAKAAVAYVLKQDGYRVASEVEGPTGEIDVVAYGTDDEPIAVEVETSPTDEVVQDKLERYVHGQPFRDMFLLDVDELPATFDEAVEWARGQL